MIKLVRLVSRLDLGLFELKTCVVILISYSVRSHVLCKRLGTILRYCVYIYKTKRSKKYIG